MMPTSSLPVDRHSGSLRMKLLEKKGESNSTQVLHYSECLDKVSLIFLKVSKHFHVEITELSEAEEMVKSKIVGRKYLFLNKSSNSCVQLLRFIMPLLLMSPRS